MSVDGPLAAAYVNPGGFVHDTLTVTEAVNLRNRELMVSRLRWTTLILCTVHTNYNKLITI